MTEEVSATFYFAALTAAYFDNAVYVVQHPTGILSHEMTITME